MARGSHVGIVFIVIAAVMLAVLLLGGFGLLGGGEPPAPPPDVSAEERRAKPGEIHVTGFHSEGPGWRLEAERAVVGERGEMDLTRPVLTVPCADPRRHGLPRE